MTRERELKIIDSWHAVCARYNAGNASGIDMRLAHDDAMRALAKAEANGVDVADLRAEHRLEIR